MLPGSGAHVYLALHVGPKCVAESAAFVCAPMVRTLEPPMAVESGDFCCSYSFSNFMYLWLLWSGFWELGILPTPFLNATRACIQLSVTLSA